ncbi:hypothetical protein DSL72_003421 [Monilinia vaccinii-corymbosi]|uniref:Uncharacterized protein n=1 Tax=Monilinia vaccinii-corymbosi TaxID=61207 RepID=A0A8A3NT88_9HELO|nr:hypothetical protein DSL72_003421 [Monilinia vaccinii-corymbosi]
MHFFSESNAQPDQASPQRKPEHRDMHRSTHFRKEGDPSTLTPPNHPPTNSPALKIPRIQSLGPLPPFTQQIIRRRHRVKDARAIPPHAPQVKRPLHGEEAAQIHGFQRVELANGPDEGETLAHAAAVQMRVHAGRDVGGEEDGDAADAGGDVGEALQERDPGVQLGERVLVTEGVAERVAESGEGDDAPEVLGGVQVEVRYCVCVFGADFVEPGGEGGGVGDGAVGVWVMGGRG